MSEKKKSEIITALHEIMKKVGYVQKKDKNEFHGYKYASEASLLEALRPEMINQGLLLIPSGHSQSAIDEQGNTHVAVDYTLAHISGEVWPEKIRAFGSGNDRAKNGNVGDKGTYKALTGANKYLLFKLFQIETGDDPEKDHGNNGNGETKKLEAPKDTTKAGVDDIPLGSPITEDMRIAIADWLEIQHPKKEKTQQARLNGMLNGQSEGTETLATLSPSQVELVFNTINGDK